MTLLIPPLCRRGVIFTLGPQDHECFYYCLTYVVALPTASDRGQEHGTSSLTLMMT